MGERPNRPLIFYRPLRSYRPNCAPKVLGIGEVAINVPSRKLYLGTDHGVLEMTDLEELIDQYVEIIKQHP